MATLLERFQLKGNAQLRQRCSAAIWDKAVRVLNAGGSTTQQKADALKRLAREIGDQEWFVVVSILGVGSATPDDAAVQSAIDTVYDRFPSP